MSSEPPELIFTRHTALWGVGDGGGGESPLVQLVAILNQLPACCCGAEKKKAFLKITVACFKIIESTSKQLVCLYSPNVTPNQFSEICLFLL